MRAAFAVTLLATPAVALTPLPPCHNVIEAGMSLGNVQTLGDYEALSGVTVEDYSNGVERDGDAIVLRKGPVPALDDFNGVRVTICATGDFVAIPGVNAGEAGAALAATEFLRGPIQSGQRVRFAQVQRAAKAVFGPVIRLRETYETCGCSTFFADQKPDGMMVFADRTDVEFR